MKRSAVFGLVCLLAVALLSGCGDGRPRRVPVSGRVTIDGKPIPCGTIRFIPKDARPAMGQIGQDGRYSMSTFEKGDGVVVGPCTVTVNATELLSGQAIRWHAPKYYAEPGRSGLSAEITEPIDSLDFDLKWNGGRPFVEREYSGGE